MSDRATNVLAAYTLICYVIHIVHVYIEYGAIEEEFAKNCYMHGSVQSSFVLMVLLACWIFLAPIMVPIWVTLDVIGSILRRLRRGPWRDGG
jgi:hypothetical protein